MQPRRAQELKRAACRQLAGVHIVQCCTIHQAPQMHTAAPNRYVQRIWLAHECLTAPCRACSAPHEPQMRTAALPLLPTRAPALRARPAAARRACSAPQGPLRRSAHQGSRGPRRAAWQQRLGGAAGRRRGCEMSGVGGCWAGREAPSLACLACKSYRPASHRQCPSPKPTQAATPHQIAESAPSPAHTARCTHRPASAQRARPALKAPWPGWSAAARPRRRAQRQRVVAGPGAQRRRTRAGRRGSPACGTVSPGRAQRWRAPRPSAGRSGAEARSPW